MSFELSSKDFTVRKNLNKILKNKKINFPIVIKPINEGSSIGVNICKNILELNK